MRMIRTAALPLLSLIPVAALAVLAPLAGCSRTDGDVTPLAALNPAPAPVSVSPLALNTNPALAPTVAVPTTTTFASAAKPGADCATFATMKPAEAFPSFLKKVVLGTPYRSLVQGQTHIYYSRVAGTKADLATVRDVVDARLVAAGLRVFGTEDEAGAEAESGFSGPHTGAINVQVLCTGELNVRVNVTQ